MNKSFIFESDQFSTNDLCNEIEITINIKATKDDYDWELESIFDNTAGIERNLEDFSKEEADKIEKRCEKVAYEYSGEAYQDALEARASDAYDRYKDKMKYGE